MANLKQVWMKIVIVICKNISNYLLFFPQQPSFLKIEISSNGQDFFIFFILMELMVRVMVFNVIFNNISVISWQFVFLVEETGGPEENHRPAASHLQALFHNVVLSTPHLNRIQTHNFSSDRHRLHR